MNIDGRCDAFVLLMSADDVADVTSEVYLGDVVYHGAVLCDCQVEVTGSDVLSRHL